MKQLMKNKMFSLSSLINNVLFRKPKKQLYCVLYLVSFVMYT